MQELTSPITGLNAQPGDQVTADLLEKVNGHTHFGTTLTH